MASPSLLPKDFWYRKVQDLMPFRIREILLISSAYDAFALEEDGPLTERLFAGYSELNLSGSPRITDVSRVSDASHLLATRRFDLVITVVRVEDGDAAEVARQVKARDPNVPVVLLTFDEADLEQFPEGKAPDTIDHVFQWTGDARVLLAVVKLIEDGRNVAHDTASGGVKVIVVVEDRVRAYSTLLAFVYGEIMTHAQGFIADGTNDMHRLLRMRVRPKLLLASTLEQACEFYEDYKDSILALITDLRFPREGVLTRDAGILLAAHVRKGSPELPILFQTSEPAAAERTKTLSPWFADKRAPNQLAQVRKFLREAVGFGDFVFRKPDGTEVGRARNIYEMAQKLQTMPLDSIEHHATGNHFSVWLNARAMFEAADSIRPRTVEEFGGAEGIRDYLIGVLDDALTREQEGMIADAMAPPSSAENRFVRVGGGSLGGKARSVAFVNALIVRYGLLHRHPGLQVRIPKTIVIGTSEYDQFVSSFETAELVRVNDEQEVLDLFLHQRLRPELRRDLRAALHALRGPLAVRSSSLLEDSRFRPFAGVYATYMLPNCDPDSEVRFEEVCRAVRAVWASTFSPDAQSYIASTPHDIDEEKMGVIIQQVVGHAHGERYYPHLSGVAQSYNYYPVGHQRSEDGVAIVALGLGETVVRGGTALRFSPATPAVLPQFPSAESYLQKSQKTFFAVDLSRPTVDFSAKPEASLSVHGLDAAEEDGTLALAGSVYSAADDVVRDTLNQKGPRVVTFNNLLRWKAAPLAPALRDLLSLLRDAVGGEVEMEFALDMMDWGREVPPGAEPRTPRLYVLQVRPMAAPPLHAHEVDWEGLNHSDSLCVSDRALGHGRIEDLVDVVYVRRADITSRLARKAAGDVRDINRALVERGRRYVLAGPGRWGTADPSLGVPVEWSHIAGVQIIIETPLGTHHAEPSQGTHFFHNVTAQRIGYLTVTPHGAGFFDQDWLDALPAEAETELVRHVRLPAPLTVLMDGLQGKAAILKPTSEPGSAD